MNTRSRRILNGLYVLITLFCASFLTLLAVRHSPWYAERLYQQLLSDSEEHQLHAASALAHLRAQPWLLRALQTDNPHARDLAQRALEYIWFNDAGARAFRLLEDAFAASQAGQAQEALSLLNELTQRFPTFAEGWNRRAAVHWQLGHYAQSRADCERALELNPLHYGAWQGFGLCQLQDGDVAGACVSLRAALKILPHDHATQVSLRRCEELLRSIAPPRQIRGDDLI